MTRLKHHAEIAHQLQHQSDEELLHLFNDTQIQATGHGMLSFLSDRINVFVKLIPLAAFEMQAQNYQSTANYFQLPTYYQYRIGSCGFGAWRELETHLMAHTWVMSGQCIHFPLLHHWRILPIAQVNYDDRMDWQRWGSCKAIHKRVVAAVEATHSVVLFLEHFPLTLSQWLHNQLLHSADPALLVRQIETQLTEILSFIHSQGVLHMDAHFDNILTNGNRLFLTDYGLSLSNRFKLDEEEQQFFKQHQTFDLSTAINSLVHAVVSSYDSRNSWRQALQQLIREQTASKNMPAALHVYLQKRAPLVMKIGDFYRQLMAELTSPYPDADFQKILDDF